MNLLKDRFLHIIFVTVIIILFGTSIYFRATRGTDVLSDEFLSKIDKLNGEQSLQQISENASPPNAIKVPILIYHSVMAHTAHQSLLQKYYDTAPESLEKQLQYLRDKGYTVIGLEFLADVLMTTITLPPKPVVLTFDDGWENQFLHAYPLLKKYNYYTLKGIEASDDFVKFVKDLNE